MTHGEAYILKRENIDFRKSFLQIEKNLRTIPKPMPRDVAMNYYKSKLREVWNALGYL
jgi:hypothetical protein